MRKQIILNGIGTLAMALAVGAYGCSSDNNNGNDAGGSGFDATAGRDATAGGQDAAAGRDATAGGQDAAAGVDATAGGMDAGGGGSVSLGAILNGEQEAPTAVVTDAIGGATFTLSGTMLTYHVVHGVQGATMMHIHAGAVGVAGGVSAAFPNANNDSSGTLALDNTTAAGLMACATAATCDFYINVHSPANPNGEIRGQISAGTVYKAALSGDQEAPTPTTSVATGKSYYILSGTTLAYYVINNVDTPTMAHLHNAPAGMAGGVVQALTPVGAKMSGTVPLVADNITQLNMGNIYVNIHNATNPNGDIRGQLSALQ